MHADPTPATPSAYVYPLLVKQLLLNAMAVHGDQEIVYRDSVRMRYRDFRGRVGRLASALSELGVDGGDTVAVLDWDSHRYLESYFAIPMMGATMFTVNVRLSPQQIEYCLNDSGASVLLVNTDFLALIEQLLPRLPHVRHVIALADGELPPFGLSLAGEYEQLLEAASPDYDFADFDENQRAAVFYTTGTTGDPKGVCYSHRQLVMHAMTTALSLCAPRQGQRLHREDVYMPITPMFHVLAWGMPYVATMLGLKSVYPGRYHPETLLELRQREGVTFSHCVPTILQMLVDMARARGIDIAGWTMVIGGSALAPALCEAALDLGVDVFTGYGMSETGPIVSLAQLGAADRDGDRAAEVARRCATGRPVPLVDFRVVDSEGREVAHDGVAQGEIVLRSPYLTQAYLGKPEASEDLWAGGYLHTQDVAVVRPDAYVRIVDRMKDVIKTGGEWVSSIQIEALLVAVPGVREAAVIGVPDARWGERPMAYVVREPGSEVDAEALRAALLEHVAARRLEKFAVPEADHVMFVDEIPKTSVGKLNKRQLRVWFNGGGRG